jgi:NDP-sugar pyrophosphorylase family protein
MQAVILAGGQGTRLRPFTINFPKPLVPLGETPILKIILNQLKYYGFYDIILAVNHFAELIMSFFKNGENIGLNLNYSIEDEMLGTAGPLSIIDDLEDDFLVMNGDILTNINYKDLYEYHNNNNDFATIATYKKELTIDLGVLEIDGKDFKNYIEKPKYAFDVSMGIYVFRKEIIDFIPRNDRMDMPDLILKLKENDKKISCYKGNYDWLDIGRISDYEEANKIFKEKRHIFAPNE